jgi:uncharacterized protein
VPFLKSQGHTVSRLVRGNIKPAADEIIWDPSRGLLNPLDIEKFDAVVNLAGEGIATGRWTEEKKKRILDSRVSATLLLSETISKLSKPIKILINASAVGIYGDRKDEILTEESQRGTDFLAHVCQEWEVAAESTKHTGTRVVCLRIGMVLTAAGGALGKIMIPFKLGLGGVIGSGKQYMSWIALDDLLGVIAFSLAQASLTGPVNAVAPLPVTNYDFAKTLGKVLHRPTVVPLPEFAAHLVFGEMADALLLSSQRVIPKRLQEINFPFQYPDLEAALEHFVRQ